MRESDFMLVNGVALLCEKKLADLEVKMLRANKKDPKVIFMVPKHIRKQDLESEYKQLYYTPCHFLNKCLQEEPCANGGVPKHRT